MVDREVTWYKVPNPQPMFRDSDGNGICQSCANGLHPHEFKYQCKILFDWYVESPRGQERLDLCSKMKNGGQCCCMWGKEK